MDVNEPTPGAADPAAADGAADSAAADDTAAALRQLESIRESIDNVDAALIHLLAERFKFTQQVGRLKAEHGLPPADVAREARQIKRLRALAEESHLDPEFAEKFLNFIVAEVIHHHTTIAATGAIPLP
ncbi:chorismate mutase [Subtercola sp. Z020]|uniref:chorismate mutase n=1 Tax=Subtercola sp. Z020 TaxID=2080582 RepID=UPI000CE8E98E|nr:chorismate mutase [Subtercola sp. Z020]PPF79884.1 chorismate mutase [Subtercola sp. Z020]